MGGVDFFRMESGLGRVTDASDVLGAADVASVASAGDFVGAWVEEAGASAPAVAD